MSDVSKGEVLEKVKKRGYELRNYPEYQDDDEVVYEAVKNQGFALQFASERLRNALTVVLAAIRSEEQRKSGLPFASDEMRDNEEVGLAAVSEDGNNLRYLSERLQNDHKICLEAVKQNKGAYEFVGVSRKYDPSVILWAKKEQEVFDSLTQNEMNELEEKYWVSVYGNKEELLDDFLIEFKMDNDVNGLCNVIKHMSLENKNYLDEILEREDVCSIKVDGKQKYVFGIDAEFLDEVCRLKQENNPYINVENIRLSDYDYRYLEGTIRINDDIYPFDYRLEDGAIDIHNFMRTHDAPLPEFISQNSETMEEIYYQITCKVENYLDEKTDDYVFDDELLVSDEKCECVNGYLLAMKGLVDRLVEQEGVPSDEMDNINFYADYNMKENTIAVDGTYWVFEKDNEEVQKDFKLSLNEEEKVFLKLKMERYCQSRNDQSCMEFLNDVRTVIEGLPEISNMKAVDEVLEGIEKEETAVLDMKRDEKGLER